MGSAMQRTTAVIQLKMALKRPPAKDMYCSRQDPQLPSRRHSTLLFLHPVLKGKAAVFPKPPLQSPSIFTLINAEPNLLVPDAGGNRSGESGPTRPRMPLARPSCTWNPRVSAPAD